MKVQYLMEDGKILKVETKAISPTILKSKLSRLKSQADYAVEQTNIWAKSAANLQAEYQNLKKVVDSLPKSFPSSEQMLVKRKES